MLLSSKICNDASNEGLSHYFQRRNADIGQRKNLKDKKIAVE